MRLGRRLKNLFTALLIIGLMFQPFFGVGVLAEAEIQEAVVTDDNQATVENNVEVVANTGDNSIVPEPTLIPAEVTPTPEELLIPTPTPTEEIINLEITITPTPSTSLGVNPTVEVSVNNDNQAVVDNTATVSATTGENTTVGDETKIDTGDAIAETDAVNIVDTNITGNNFEQVIVNVDQSTLGDLDLSDVEIAETSNLESVNIASADFLSALAVYNTNDATLINNLQLLAISGENQIVGPNGEILTGDALANLNLFNLVNTNLTGQDWFFGVINLMGDFEGNIILPYEWQFLGEGIDAPVDNSQNQVSVDNNNSADLTNNISVTANTGNNQIVGDGEIKTGNADASVNLINFVNTNITGSRWLLLAINNFGSWQGELSGWWGNLQMIQGTTFAWVRLPDLPSEQGGFESLTVKNDNTATVENNIEVTADTGGNQIQGEKASIETGNAQASANVFNMINTNITGNNWYFGMVNIFDDFIGNIIFPRPDLLVAKNADKNEVLAGEEITYTISYKNQGRVWAKDVIINDILPEGVTFISASDNGVFENGKVVWSLGKVSVSQSGSLTLVVRVNAEVAAGTQLENSVKIETATCEPNKGNNTSSAAVSVIAEVTPTPTPGGSGSSEGGVGGATAATGCSDTPPKGAPVLLSAVPGENSVVLTWSKAADPVSYYLVAYGLSSGNYIYGNTNIGGPETTSYTINELSGGTAYYFVVRAGNGCAPGPYSNEIRAMPLGGFIFEAKAAEGELGEAVSTEEEGEVAGAQTKSACPWWLILSLANLGVVGGYFWFLKGKERRFWWLIPIASAVVAYSGDHYLAHQYFQPGRYCDWMWLWSILGSGIPTALKAYL